MCRELYGRGLIGSLKATTWWQQLQEKQNKAAQQSAPLKDGVRVQASPPLSFSFANSWFACAINTTTLSTV